MYEEAPDMMPKDLYNEIHRGIVNYTNNENGIRFQKPITNSLRAKYEEGGDRRLITNDINTTCEEIEKIPRSLVDTLRLMFTFSILYKGDCNACIKSNR